MPRLVAALGLAIALGAAPAAAVETQTQPAQPSYTEAKAYVDSLQFSRALPILQEIVRAEPGNADAWNLLAFSQRNLGDVAAARENYDRALALDPNHKGALEYLGELFLTLNDIEAAQANLAKLAALCPSGCEEREELEQAIAAYQAQQGS